MKIRGKFYFPILVFLLLFLFLIWLFLFFLFSLFAYSFFISVYFYFIFPWLLWNFYYLFNFRCFCCVFVYIRGWWKGTRTKMSHVYASRHTRWQIHVYNIIMRSNNIFSSFVLFIIREEKKIRIIFQIFLTDFLYLERALWMFLCLH